MRGRGQGPHGLPCWWQKPLCKLKSSPEPIHHLYHALQIFSSSSLLMSQLLRLGVGTLRERKLSLQFFPLMHTRSDPRGEFRLCQEMFPLTAPCHIKGDAKNKG